MSKEPSAVEKLLGGFAPKLVDLTDNVLFGDVLGTPGAIKARPQPRNRGSTGRSAAPRATSFSSLLRSGKWSYEGGTH